MKILVLSSLVLLATAAVSTASAVDYEYTCGDKTVIVEKKRAKYVVHMSWETAPSGRRYVINLESEPMTLKLLRAAFNGGDTVVDDDTGSESGLPKGSLAFSGFHYPTGDMFIAAEGDTNEEGYTFATEKGLVEGAESVAVADIYWNDRRPSNVTKYTCRLAN